jgi:hypothetical protein
MGIFDFLKGKKGDDDPFVNRIHQLEKKQPKVTVPSGGFSEAEFIKNGFDTLNQLQKKKK